MRRAGGHPIFFDRLRIALVVDWLASKGVHGCLIGGLVRLHYSTALSLSIGAWSFDVPRRSRGVLTGTLTAVTMARIPLESILLKRAVNLSQLGFKLASRTFALATWIDNLFAFANHPSDAISILEVVEDDLNEQCQLEYGDDNLLCLTCQGNPDQVPVNTRWKGVTSMKILGHLIAWDGGVEECYQATMASAWNCFYANCAREFFGNSHRSEAARLRLLDRCVLPIVSFRFTRWPFTIKRADLLDRNLFLMSLKNSAPAKQHGESKRVYFARATELINAHWSRKPIEAVISL